MGDFIYDGVHSITFQNVVFDSEGHVVKNADGTIKLKNQYKTWMHWHMAPKSRPYVESPAVKTAYVDVPGADGSLDYTEALSGKSNYTNRTGQWEFILDNGYTEWFDTYTDILEKLHGKYFDRIILDDDPRFYYTGRVSVKGNFSPKDYNMITMEYNLDPYKRLVDSEEVIWWKWKELFGNTMEFGPFQVNGVKARNFINAKSDEIVAQLKLTSAMNLYPYDGSEYMQSKMFSKDFTRNPDSWDCRRLASGYNEIVLQPGDNYYFFEGYGNVSLEYERGAFL